ncbi:MAG: protein kinase [Candidatus Eisenbacteria bacterium]
MNSGDTQARRLGRYRILGELGRGGMGVVLLGEDPTLARKVAIKMLPRELAENPEAYTRFEREARLLAALNHPNVATIHSLESIDGVPILTMEHIEGRTLAARLRVGPLPVEELLRVGTKVARAIEAAHERGVIHRDLKPGNVMLRDDGEVKVLDFGLAIEAPLNDPSAPNSNAVATSEFAATLAIETPATDRAAKLDHSAADAASVDALVDATQVDVTSASPGASGEISGTFGYMSPEQITGGPVDARSDLFGLGCVFFECATGARAFRGDTMMARARSTLSDAPSAASLPRAVPAPIREVILACLSKSPEGRPAHAQAVRKIFEDQLESFLFTLRAETLVSGISAPAESGTHNLPNQLSSFVGRAQELAAVSALVESHPLVTLTGAGGSGKTRLAIEVARTLLSRGWPGDVWWIELASLGQASLLEKTIMTVIGLKESTDRPARDTILEHLARKNALLLFDNCEHLLDATASLARALVQRCPGLRILVTSREALGLDGEVRHAVPPLSIEELAEGRSPEQLRESEAVRLFVERARLAQPSFELNEANLPAVVGICRRLDGLPLALELAASRVRALDPASLLARLDDRFRLLTGGSREKLPHQRTLLASIEWSHEQLSEPERALFRRLGVFAGSFTLESVEAVCVDDTLESWDVLDAMTSLLDKSMIEPAMAASYPNSGGSGVNSGDGSHSGSDAASNADSPAAASDSAVNAITSTRVPMAKLIAAPRYRMLETFRQYADAKLAEAGERAAQRERFARHWKEQIAGYVRRLSGPEGNAVLKRIDRELGNFREALTIALEEMNDSEVALRLAANMLGYWLRRAHWSEGKETMRRALSLPGAERPTQGRAVALNSFGVMMYYTGRYEEAVTYLVEAIELFEQQNMRIEAAGGHLNLGNAYAFLGRVEEGLRAQERVLALARELNHDWLVAAALVNICNAAEALGDIDRVETTAEEAVAHMTRTGDRGSLIMALYFRGAVAYRRGRFEDGVRIMSENLALALELGDRYQEAHQRIHRGMCLAALGRDREALEDYIAGLEIAHEYDDPNLLNTALESLAQRERVRGDLVTAARWLSLSDFIRKSRAVPERRSNAAGTAEARASLRAALGDAAYEKCVEAGAVETVEAVLARVRMERDAATA